MCLIGFSFVASSSVVTPILSIYVRDVIYAPVEMVGLVAAIFFIVSALTRISLGVFAGGKKTVAFLLFAFLIYSISPAFYPFIDSVQHLIFLRSAQGFASAFIGTTSLILAAISISIIERDVGVGIYTVSLSLGLLAGPAITTFSIPMFGVSNTFYFASLMGLIGFFAAFYLHTKVSAIERNWQIIGVAVDRESIGSKISTIARNRMFHTAFIGNFAFFLLFGVLLAYAPLHAKENLYFGDGGVSMLFLLYYISTTVTRFSVGKIAGSISKSTLIIISTASATFLSFTLSIVKDNLAFAVVFALIGAVQGVLFPAGSMLIAESIHPSRNALANSLYMMGMDIGQGMAPLITASVAVQQGLEYSFMIPAAISAAATLLIIRLNIHR